MDSDSPSNSRWASTSDHERSAEDIGKAGTGHDRSADLTGFRLLILGWCLWLLGSWSITLTMTSTQPAVRWMVFSAMIGMMAIWPAFRLSQAPLPDNTVRSRRMVMVMIIIVDWLGLQIIFQAVLWPLQWMAGWSFEQGLMLDLSLAGWSFITGLIIVSTIHGRRWLVRTWGMLLCLLVIFGGLLAIWLYTRWGGGSVAMESLTCYSPVLMLWSLTAAGFEFDSRVALPCVLFVGISGLSGWGIYLFYVRFRLKLLEKPTKQIAYRHY